MTTKQEMVSIIKLENPILRVGDDERGYTQLDETDYENTISDWADVRLTYEATEAAAEQTATDKAALLAKLGITADEFKTLLS